MAVRAKAEARIEPARGARAVADRAVAEARQLQAALDMATVDMKAAQAKGRLAPWEWLRHQDTRKSAKADAAKRRQRVRHSAPT